MNWITGFYIWLKGIFLFSISLLLVFPIGLFAIPIVLMISWVAIPIYAIMLWLLKMSRTPYKVAMLLMMVIPTWLAVLAALHLNNVLDDELYSPHKPIVFWVSYVCCVLVILSSKNSIYLYLHPEEAVEAFTID
jgi:hypothetical protein